MSASLSLPVWATVKAAYLDVFAGGIGFARVSWLILLMMVLFVEIPTIMVTETIYQSLHPELAQGQEKMPAPVETSPTNPSAEVTAEDMFKRGERVKVEYLALLMAFNLFQMALIFSFSVAWYRQLLFAENKGKTIVFSFGKPEWEFAVTSMKAGFVLAPVVLVMMSYALASLPGFAEGKPESLEDNWPLFASGILLIFYLTARISMSYPLTVMAKTQAPIKDAWKMTAQSVWRIIAGNILVTVPVFVVSVALVIGLSAMLNPETQMAIAETVAQEPRLPFAQHILYKAIGAAFMLVVFALISAFYARAHAFLVRSQQDTPPADMKA